MRACPPDKCATRLRYAPTAETHRQTGVLGQPPKSIREEQNANSALKSTVRGSDPHDFSHGGFMFRSATIVGVEAASGPRVRLPKYVQQEHSRHGKTTYYVRRGSGPRTRIYAEPGTAEFMVAYEAALAGSPVAKPEPPASLSPTRRQIDLQLRRVLKGAADRSKGWGREFDLDLDWALSEVERTNLKCPMTGIPFYMKASTSSRGIHPYAPSIDRIDCAKGYTRDNCRIVVFAFNIMLNDWGEDVFARVANGFRANRYK